RMYEDLANHYARYGESRQRDNCLVLAADAALSAGSPEEAERLRRRLLLTNPHHLLRPYSSMVEAMQTQDVRDFVADLRKQISPDMVAKLLHQAAPEKTYALEQRPDAPAAASKARAPKSAPEPQDESPSAASYWVSLILLGLGLLLAAGLLFAALVWPLME